ncbi:G5 domain-containing protein [Clostridium sp. D2Q-11]|uniref:G5 domain-containing protein n=1 Tax=Anaeromonas frigoriresistens TaxID=2683708 RepID=A0A942URL1_9FIRM|nr:G5 domain-containing protein [Anaeromonas frigoriresistens]MBS4537903.1 G5 domain-containing protein [Anaeromonas frigoriresistens]
MHTILKNKKWLLAMGTVFAIALFSFVLHNNSFAEVKLTVDNETKTIKTASDTVEEFIDENDIYIGDSDYINLNKDEKLEKGMEVIIKRSTPVTIKIGNQSITRKTYKNTVKDILNTLDIEYDVNDRVEPGLSTTYEKNMVINLTRVEKKEVVEEDKIQYNTMYKDNKSLDLGKTRVAQEGSEGVKEITKSQVFENGKLVKEEVVSEKVVKEPVNKIVEKGKKPITVASRGKKTTPKTTRPKATTSRSSTKGSKTITMTATAYNLQGNTASGVPSGPGKIAVDPSVIPLGTRLYIESLDGWGDYGYAVAADTGSAIRGNKVDLFYTSENTCLRFGRRKVKVHILD